MLRQVRSHQFLLDIVATNAFQYTICYYSCFDISGPGSNGIYSTTGAPLVMWRVENPAGSASCSNTLRLVKSVQSVSYVYDFTYSDLGTGESEWRLVSGDGLSIRTTHKKWTLDSGCTNIHYVETVSNGFGQVLGSKATYACLYPWGEEKYKVIDDPDHVASTTLYQYYGDSAETGRYSRVKSINYASGSWVKYDYDSHGRVSEEIRPWKDSESNAIRSEAYAVFYSYDPVANQDNGDSDIPRIETHKVEDVIVKRIYKVVITNAVEEIRITEECADGTSGYGNPSNNFERIVSYSANNTNVFLRGKLKSVERRSGSLDSYLYERGSFHYSHGSPEAASFEPGIGDELAVNVIHGTIVCPAGVSHKTTSERSVIDSFGNTLLEEESVYNGSIYERIRWTVREFDELNRTTVSLSSNGQRWSFGYNGYGVTNQTNAEGENKSFSYDTLGRMNRVLRRGVSGFLPDLVQSNEYDAIGRVTVQTSAQGALVVQRITQYDMLGRITNTVINGVNESKQFLDEGRTEVITNDRGLTTTNKLYRDGQLKSKEGIGVKAAEFYDYSVITNSGHLSAFTHFGAADSARWKKVEKDSLSRVTLEAVSGINGRFLCTAKYYNDKGQLVCENTPGIANTLFVYDAAGNLLRQGLDVDRDGVLSEFSDDRIQQKESYYTQLEGGWWREQSFLVWANSLDATPITNRVSRERVSGLATNVLSEKMSLDQYGNVTRETTLVDPNLNEVTIITVFPDSTNEEVKTTVFGHVKKEISRTGVSKTYLYEFDAGGTTIHVKDQRVGTRSDHMNVLNLVDWSLEPGATNKTSYSYDRSTGMMIEKTDPCGFVTRYDYTASGQLMHVWGSGALPISISYDQYGKIVEKMTFRGGFCWDSQTWPTNTLGVADVTHYEYDEASGLMTAKHDANGCAMLMLEYDDVGQVVRWTQVRSGAISNRVSASYQYDTNTSDRISIHYSDDTPSVLFGYDRMGRLVRVTDSVGNHSFVYDRWLRLAEETIEGGCNSAIVRTYQTNGVLGRYVGIDMDSTCHTSYQYDQVGRLSEMLWRPCAQFTRDFKFSYLDGSDLLRSIEEPTVGFHTETTFEPQRDLITRTIARVGTNIVSQYDCTYDESARRNSIKKSGSAFGEWTNTFCLISSGTRSELLGYKTYIGADIGNTNYPVLAESFKYEYDNAGNRILIAAGTNEPLAFMANSLNQFTVKTNPTSEFAYDESGNMVDDSTFNYQWDAENRLISVAPNHPTNGAIKLIFSYDYMGRRWRTIKTEWGNNQWSIVATNLFSYDGWSLVREIQFVVSSQSVSTNHYLWGLENEGVLSLKGESGSMLAIARNGSSNCLVCCHDPCGSIAQLVVAETGEIVARYEYDPYGNILRMDGIESEANRFRYAGKEFEPSCGLVYYGLRYYVPSLGKWLTREPLFASPEVLNWIPLNVIMDSVRQDSGIGVAVAEGNLYEFARNSPTDVRDSLGLWCQSLRASKVVTWPDNGLSGFFFLPGSCRPQVSVDIRLDGTDCGVCCPSPKCCKSVIKANITGRGSGGVVCDIPLAGPFPLWYLKLQLQGSASISGNINIGGCDDQRVFTGCFNGEIRGSADMCVSFLIVEVCCGGELAGGYRKCIPGGPGRFYGCARLRCRVCRVTLGRSRNCYEYVIYEACTS
jgi:RHS repeat-associated protein